MLKFEGDSTIEWLLEIFNRYMEIRVAQKDWKVECIFPVAYKERGESAGGQEDSDTKYGGSESDWRMTGGADKVTIFRVDGKYGWWSGESSDSYLI